MIGRRDAALCVGVGAAGALLLAPFLLRPSAAMGNFGDLYAFHIPLQHLAASRLAAGEMPFWNPYILAGLPHLANPQTALFYPPAAILRLFPLVWAFSAYQALHLFLAALGAHFLARRLGSGPVVAAGLGAAYALSPFVAGRVLQGVPTLLAALAWVPWCWLALVDKRAWLLAGAWGLQGLSGHPQFAAVNALAMAAWSLREPRGRGRAFLLAAAGAAALGAVQAVPSAFLLSRSSRTGLPDSFLGAYSMPWKAFGVLLHPRPFGTPRAGTFDGDPSEWFEEFTLHLGPVPAALAAAGAAAPGGAAALALAGAGAALAVGANAPWWPLWKGSALATLSRVPARWGLWTLWGLWLAAALGAGWAARAGLPRALRVGTAALLFAGAAAGASGLFAVQETGRFLGANRAVAERLGGRLARVLTAPELPNADKAMLYRMMNVNGYEAFYPGAYAAYAARAEGRPAADPSRVYLSNPASPEMSRLGVSAVVPGPRGAAVGEVPGGLGIARLASGAAVGFDSPRPELWRARGEGKGPLVLAVPADPGWRAWVDGSPVPVLLHDGLVMSVEVPAGPFSAAFRYTPLLWPWLCAAAVLAWGLWAAIGMKELAS